MSRLSFLPLLVIATLALLATVKAQAATPAKPECVPLHGLYKTWVKDCIANGIPNADNDPKWQPCICKNGFYNLATASENCLLGGSTQQRQITPASLDNLCKSFAGYTPADKQTPSADLAPAVQSATAILAAQPTGGAGGAGGSGSAAVHAASSQSFVSLMMVSFVAVALATAATF